MATLLNGVNEVLKRVGQHDTDTGVLSSLESASRQPQIDLTVQLWNETVDELYTLTDEPRPNNLVEESTSVVLVADQRAYTLPDDLVQMLWPLMDETNSQVISEYPGGYMALVRSQLEPDNFTGLPLAGAIRPTDEALYLDRIPTSEEAGRVYKLRYLKDTEMTVAESAFPFKDDIFRMLVPAVANRYKREKHNLSGVAYQLALSEERKALALAAKRMRRTTIHDTWGPQRVRHTTSPSDPMEK